MTQCQTSHPLRAVLRARQMVLQTQTRTDLQAKMPLPVTPVRQSQAVTQAQASHQATAGVNHLPLYVLQHQVLTQQLANRSRLHQRQLTLQCKQGNSTAKCLAGHSPAKSSNAKRPNSAGSWPFYSKSPGDQRTSCQQTSQRSPNQGPPRTRITVTMMNTAERNHHRRGEITPNRRSFQ